MSGSTLEAMFLWAARSVGLPEPEREFRFDAKRKWRADFRFGNVLVEIEGGEWQKCRHTTGAGYTRDAEKYNAMTMAGFKLLRFTGTMIREDALGCAEMVAELLETKLDTIP